jgi:hypothetical protein
MRRWLEADGERCLLVLGNAADPDLIEPCVPSVGRATVIITTNQQAMANLGTAVPVDVFTEQQAMDFLGDRTGLADAAGAAALAKEVGCLPLALAQAAAVIGGQHLSYAHYLGQLRRTPVAGLLARSRRGSTGAGPPPRSCSPWTPSPPPTRPVQVCGCAGRAGGAVPVRRAAGPGPGRRGAGCGSGLTPPTMRSI